MQTALVSKTNYIIWDLPLKIASKKKFPQYFKAQPIAKVNDEVWVNKKKKKNNLDLATVFASQIKNSGRDFAGTLDQLLFRSDLTPISCIMLKIHSLQEDSTGLEKILHVLRFTVENCMKKNLLFQN